MAFLEKITPRWIISFHQPLNGVDTDSKDRRLSAAWRGRSGSPLDPSTAAASVTAP